MNIELAERERNVVRHALEWYLSDLRQEIAGTDTYDFRVKLHDEEDVLKGAIEKLHQA